MIRYVSRLSLGCCLALTACGKYTAESSQSAMAQAASAENIFALTPLQTLSYTWSALYSAVNSYFGATIIGSNLHAALTSSYVESAAVPGCSIDGWAFDATTADLMADTHPSYASRSLYCQMQGEAGNLESFRSVIAWPYGIVCQLGRQQEITFGSSAQEWTGTIHVEPNDSCFPAGFAASQQGLSFGVKVSTTPLADNAKGWTQQLRLESADQPSINETLHIVEKGSWIAVSSDRGWSFSLDYSGSTLRFARLDKDTENNLQMLFMGPVDPASGSLYYVDRAEAIFSFSFRIASLAGYYSTGYKTHAFVANLTDYTQRYADSGMTANTYYHLGANCLGGYCRGVEGPVIDSTADLDFVLQPGTLDANGLLNAGPLSFLAVDYMRVE